jgi:hypothetical protein
MNSTSLLTVQHSSIIVNFDEKKIFIKSFPELFPFGLGGVDQVRKTPISLTQWVRHLLRLSTGTFRRHSSFSLLAFDILNRKKLSEAQLIKCKMNPLLTEIVSSVTETELQNYLAMENQKINAIKIGLNPIKTTPNNASIFVKSIEKILQHGWFSDEERVYERTRLFAYSNQLGAPHLFVTLSPDGPNQILLRYWSHQMNVQEFVSQSNNVTASSLNGASCAEVFDYQIQWFIKHLLKYENGVGIFGKVKAYFGAVESQSTTNLHIHMLIWIEGLPDCNETWKLAMLDVEYKKKIVEYYDSIRSCSFPNDKRIKYCSFPDCNGQIKSVEYSQELFKKSKRDASKPCLAICSVCKRNPISSSEVLPTVFINGPEAIKDTSENLISILKQVQEHDYHHRKSCFKKTSRNPDPNQCRFRFPQIPCDEPTCFDSENNLKYPRTLGSEYLNPYNKNIALAFKCNHDVSPLPGSGATQASFYSMKYATKKQQKIENSQNLIYMRMLERIQKEKSIANNVTKTSLGYGRISSMVYHLSKYTEVPETVASLYLYRESGFYVSHESCSINLSDLIETINKSTRITSLVKNENNEYVHIRTIDDYLYRPDAYKPLCLYLFSQWFQKSCDKTTTANRFKDAHPQHKTHILKKLTKFKIVTVIAKRLPSAKATDAEQLLSFHQTILILFKPFTSLNDILGSHTCWQSAYQEFIYQGIPQHVTNYIRRNEDFWDFKDSQQTEISKPTSAAKTHELEDSEGDVEEQDFFQEHLLSATSEHDDPICFLFNKDLALYNNLTNHSIVPCTMANPSLSQNAIVNQISVEPVKTIIEIPYGPFPCYQTRIVLLNSLIQSDKPYQAPGSHNFVCPTIDSVSHLYNLNSLQHLAFTKIAKHLCKGFIARLESRISFPVMTAIHDNGFYLYLGGPGGTGKTLILKALKYFIEAWGFPQSLATMAYTGKAALGCLGTTIHSFFSLLPHSTTINSKPTPEQIAKFAPIQVIVIDEISMLGQHLWASISSYLQKLKQNNLPFGGI